MDEIWKDIEGYEGLYQISNKGRVKSLKWGKERILRPGIDTSGYCFIILYNDSVSKTFKLHRLVAQTFIPNLYNKSQVNHKDECKTNNTVENLEWATAKENSNYGSRNERLSRKILQYSKSGEFVREWQSAAEVERVLGIDHGNIANCCKGKLKSAGGYIWQYKEKD